MQFDQGLGNRLLAGDVGSVDPVGLDGFQNMSPGQGIERLMWQPGDVLIRSKFRHPVVDVLEPNAIDSAKERHRFGGIHESKGCRSQSPNGRDDLTELHGIEYAHSFTPSLHQNLYRRNLLR